MNPYEPLYIIPFPNDEYQQATVKIEAVTKLHQQASVKIEAVIDVYKQNSNMYRKHRVFQDGDLVLVHMRKERFPNKS